jgi:ABC-type sugar transport system substrate-binding protein
VPEIKGLSWRRWIAAPAVLAILAVAGCGSSDDSSSGETPSRTTAAVTTEAPAEVADISGKKITLVTPTSQNPFNGAYMKTLEDELEGAGADLTTLENNYDATAEAQDMAQAISRRPDLILTLATDPVGIAVNIKRAKAAKIPVINVVGPLSPEGAELVDSNLIANDEELGRIAARNLQAGFESAGIRAGKIAAITGTSAMLITKARMDGFKDELAKTPEHELVEEQDGNWDPVRTAQIAGSLFSKYRSKGQLNGIYGMADYMAAAVVSPAEQAGLKPGERGGLVITGSNCASVGVDAIKEGKMYGGATQSPIAYAESDARWIAAFLNGEEIPKTVYDRPVAVTAENVDDYAVECKF